MGYFKWFVRLLIQYSFVLMSQSFCSKFLVTKKRPLICKSTAWKSFSILNCFFLLVASNFPLLPLWWDFFGNSPFSSLPSKIQWESYHIHFDSKKGVVFCYEQLMNRIKSTFKLPDLIIQFINQRQYFMSVIIIRMLFIIWDSKILLVWCIWWWNIAD